MKDTVHQSTDTRSFEMVSRHTGHRINRLPQVQSGSEHGLLLRTTSFISNCGNVQRNVCEFDSICDRLSCCMGTEGEHPHRCTRGMSYKSGGRRWRIPPGRLALELVSSHAYLPAFFAYQKHLLLICPSSTIATVAALF